MIYRNLAGQIPIDELSHRPVELLAVSSSGVCTVVWMKSVDEGHSEVGNEDP